MVTGSSGGRNGHGFGCFGAAGFFETIRVEQGRPHLLDAHIRRLRRSAMEWGVVPVPAPETVAALVRDACASMAGEPMRLRLVLAGDGSAVPRLSVSTCPLDDHYRGPVRSRKTWSAAIIEEITLASSHPLAPHKSTDRMIFSRARSLALERGCDEGILLNERGLVVEASAFNLFLVKDDMLLYPSPTMGGLPGVFAAYLMETAFRKGVSCAEAEPTSDELFAADAVFMTNSLGEMIALDRIDGRRLPPAFSHPMVSMLADTVELERGQRGDTPGSTGELL